MIQNAEIYDFLVLEQYGSGKRKPGIECALNKILIFDILQQTKKSAVICSCDLKSCYDRIVHSFALMAMQQAAEPLSAIESMISTIQQLKHVISWGNGVGLEIWAVISTDFFDLLRYKGCSFKMKAPLSKLALPIAGCEFLDDTDIMQIGLDDDDYYTVAAKPQEAVCTKVSGGALVPSKSWYELVDFEWNDGEWSYIEGFEEHNEKYA